MQTVEHDHSPAQGDALHPLADISERLEAARTLIETRFSDAGGRLAGSLDMVSSLIESLDHPGAALNADALTTQEIASTAGA